MHYGIFKCIIFILFNHSLYLFHLDPILLLTFNGLIFITFLRESTATYNLHQQQGRTLRFFLAVEVAGKKNDLGVDLWKEYTTKQKKKKNSSIKSPKSRSLSETNIIWYWASLVAQWLRVCLPMQGTRVRALVWEDPTCRGAAGPVSHNYWACASGACAPQQERPRQWEACAPRWRVAPACRN